MIFTSEDLSRTLKIAKHLSNVDLGVTVRRARDTFREQTTAILIEWLVDLIRSYIYGNDGMTVRELVAARLFDRRNKDPALAIHNRLSPVNPSKLEWLFFYHTRLWKRPRFRLKDLYITILSLSHEHKIAMGKSITLLSTCSYTNTLALKLYVSPTFTTASWIRIY